MSSQKLEYDACLGGRHTLPTHISTYHYAAGALQEIKSLIANAEQPATSKLIFQTLPKHMRRRAMSHHPKRLPRKYRAAHKSQMSKAGNQPTNSKRPSRKYRRRPRNLLLEYARRQRRHAWLETHIWHAKRFHMIDRWGYRLPYASCDKTYRVCYRASAQNCLLQDISYYCCVQLSGSLEQLRQGFARISSSECGLSIAAKTYLSGRREGHIELFRDGQYPFGALQRVSFMWRPLEEGEEEAKRTLWLWLHPSGAAAIIEQLQQIFELKSTKQQALPLNEESEEEDKEKRFCTHTKAFQRHLHCISPDGEVELLVLKGNFNRFRLTGPRAQRVLAASLRAYRATAAGGGGGAANHWLAQMQSANPSLRDIHETQANYSEAALSLSSPSELLSNLIMGLNIVDPRLQRPSKRSQAQSIASSNLSASQLPPDCLPRSLIWQLKLRDELGAKMLSTHQYNQLRERHGVVPGQSCAFEQQMQPLPVLLIQRPGSQQKRLGYGCGWDLIAPARYGLSLWLTLIMWGARPGGLREFDSVAREAGGEPHLPDTLAGLAQASLSAAELQARYFRLPPNKRCNYRKLAIVSPFSPPWTQLVRDWLPAGHTITSPLPHFNVLRQRQLLQLIDDSLRRRQKFPMEKQLPPDCLIQIQLRLLARGKLHANAIICLPKRQDLKRRLKQLKKQDLSPVWTEPAQPDLNEKSRKALRLSHKRLLKRLRGRRVREKRRRQEHSTKRVHIRPAHTSQLVSAHLAEMCRLWLPLAASETKDSVRRQCSRDVCGYVSSASFSLVEATVCGVGYVTAEGLRQLLEGSGAQSPLCLVRDVDSRDYRFASLRVNLDVAAPPF